MFTEDGDQAVAYAVSHFLDTLDKCLSIKHIPTGLSRLNLIQNSKLLTDRGFSYDYYLGNTKIPLPPEQLPDYIFMPGEYDE